MNLYLDFETYSAADLRRVGAYRYAADPTTEVLCCAYAAEDDDVQIWTPGGPVSFLDAITHYLNLGREGLCTWIAHNCEFERAILHRVLGFKYLPLDRWEDTAALAARMSLPRRLEDLACFFGLDTSDKEAADVARLGESVCRPRRPSRADPSPRWTPANAPEKFEALYRRCRRDVELTREIHRRLLPLSEKERRIWQSTLRMNERGVRVDLESIPAAKAVVARAVGPMEAEFDLLVGEKPKSYARVAKALGLPDVRKPTVRKALRDPALPLPKRRALEILQALNKSSVAKLDAMIERADADGRVRGSFLYCGAERTGRWSANGLQIQNIPRGLGEETDAAFAALHAGCLEVLFEGRPMPPPAPPLSPVGIVAEMLRGFLVGPFTVGDLSQIEARTLAWIAGEEKELDLFRRGGDPYCAMASEIYGHEVTKKDKDERFMGKQAVLGAGYGIGAGGFQFMLDDVYDVQVSLEFAERVVRAYRRAHPAVVRLWDRVGRGFLHAFANDSRRIKVTDRIFMGNVRVADRRYLYVEIPSGRRLYYADPALDDTRRGPAVHYFGRSRTGEWGFVHTYGGKLTENIVQATARDVIAEAMLRIEDAGFPVVGTVHDEIIAEGVGRAAEFHDLMVRVPEWAEGLPVEAEVFESERYRK